MMGTVIKVKYTKHIWPFIVHKNVCKQVTHIILKNQTQPTPKL